MASESSEAAITQEKKKKDIAWDKSNFVSNFLVSTGAQFFASFLSFLISYLILKKYNQDVLGELVLLVSITQVFVFLSNWSIVSLQKLGTEEFLDHGNIRSTFSNRLALFGANYLLVVLLFFAFSSFLPVTFTGGVLALTYGFILALNAHFYAGFQARKVLKFQALMQVAEKSLIMAGLFLLIRFTAVTVNKLLLIYLLAALLVSLVCLAVSYKQLSFRLDKQVIRRITRFSLPLIPYSIVSFLSTNYTDSFFLKEYVKQGDIGLYSIAYQFNGIWLQIPTILGGIILPFFITSNKQHSIENTLGYIRQYGITMNNLWTVASFCFITGLLVVLPFIYSDFTQGFFTCLYLFIAGSAISFSSGVFFSPFLLSNGILKITLPLALMSATSNIIGNLVLIPRYGIAGSALSSVIFGFLFATTLTIYISRKFHVDLRKFLFNNILIFCAILVPFFYSNLLVLTLAGLVLFSGFVLTNLQKTKKVFQIILSGLRRHEVNNVV